MVKRLAKTLCIFALFLAIAYMGTKIGVASYKRYLIRVKMNELQAQVNSLEARNKEILAFLQNLENPEYLLLKTKEQFNLKEEGENVVAIALPQDQKQDKYADGNGEKSNYWKEWVRFLFGSETK